MQDYSKLRKENERLKEWKKDLLTENIELENIRKEAIEYIKAVGVRPKEIDSFVLLNILKGEDK